MKKVILSTIAVALTVLGLGSIATISPAYANVIVRMGLPIRRLWISVTS